MGCDSAVAIVTRYRPGIPGIKFLWGQDFLHPSIPVLGPTQPPIQWVPGLTWGYSGCGVVLIPPHPALKLEKE